MSSPESRLLPGYTPEECERCQHWAQQPDRHVLTLDDPHYPPLLREIADAPPVLFVRGNVEVLSLPQIGIVGSRHPTVDGCENARAFAMALSAAGYVVTSGMALGIDSEAHKGALARDGITVAVLGAGLDTIPIGKHRALAEKIAKRGAVVSEFMPDISPQPYHFPQRNRVISGLAHGVLVIEAAEQSGSLITARLAGEQGREVFALPGSIHNPLARGCHRLIRQGAKLVQSVEDIFEEFPALVQWEQQRIADANKQALTKPLRKLLAHIGYDPVPVDTLLQRTGGELTDLYANLMKLELRGLILNRSDGYVLSTS
jgi:DNA processing protein